MKKISSILFLFFVCITASQASGISQPPCTVTVASPETINSATANAKPGAVICVANGTYNERVYFGNSGTSSAWIILRAINMGQAKIVGNGGNAVSINNKSYIEVSGFDITATGTNSYGIYAGNCATPSTCGHHATVIYNTVHNCGGAGIAFAHRDYSYIASNKVYQNAFTDLNSSSGISIWEPVASDNLPGYHNQVLGNTLYQNDNKFAGATDGNGIIIDDFQATQNHAFAPYNYPTLVEENLSYSNGGAGIHVYHSNNVTVQNNTVWKNHTRIGSSTWKGDLSNVYSNNNTWVKNISVAAPFNAANSAIGEYGGSQNVLWKQNDLSGSKLIGTDDPRITATTANGNLFGVNPEFVNAPSDFQLQNGSPATGLGAF